MKAWKQWCWFNDPISESLAQEVLIICEGIGEETGRINNKDELKTSHNGLKDNKNNKERNE